jgi:septal ring factor EnvC (AmiA/AmiB activator)
MLKIDEKIIRTQQKISKYHQYIQELDFECESTSQEIEETKRLLHKMVSPSPFLRSLSNELT